LYVWGRSIQASLNRCWPASLIRVWFRRREFGNTASERRLERLGFIRDGERAGMPLFTRSIDDDHA
jgi:hypothetical protein